MMGFQSPVDIGNRALQLCGANRVASFTEDSKNASEVSFAYDKMREAELKRRTWTFTTSPQVLRPIDTTTMRIAPALWASTTTYFTGSIVADQSGNLWVSRIPNNLNNDPLLTTFWDPYFGPRSVSLFDATTTYFSGELVYTAPGDGTYRVYLSLVSANADVPATPTAYDATVTYFKNQVVTSASIAYMSLVDLNMNNTPATSPTMWTTTFVGGIGSDKWLEIGGAEFPSGVALTTLNLVYPLGTGPSTQTTTKNAFLLPAGYIRRAPQNPKPGLNLLGGPTGSGFDDWLIEREYIISSETGPIPLRFIANFTDVARMDSSFCEIVAIRIAVAICDAVTQDKGQLKIVTELFAKWEAEVLMLDGTEDGFVEPPDDDLVTVRQ